jgi:homoserine kinase type II
MKPCDDEKLIGVYESQDAAQAAVERLRVQPGFRDTPEGFQIHRYEINRDHWTEGYVTV